MKPKNFPMRRKLRQQGVKRSNRPPEVADIRFRVGAKKRKEWQ